MIKNYLSAAMAISIMQIVDALAFMSDSWIEIRQAFSLVEIIWFLVSIAAFFLFKKNHMKTVVPKLFIAYISISFLYASYRINTVDLASEALIPTGFGIFALIFALIYGIYAKIHYQTLFSR